MQTIQPIQLENSSDTIKRLVANASTQTGLPSNLTRTLAQSPGVLEGYLQFQRTLEASHIDRKQREQIALAVAQANLCEYSLAYHTHLAKKAGLTDDQIVSSREGISADRKLDAMLRFVRALVADRGDSSPEELQREGYSAQEIIEIVALVGLNIFENYVNMVANTDVDMPRVALKLKVA